MQLDSNLKYISPDAQANILVTTQGTELFRLCYVGLFVDQLRALNRVRLQDDDKL
jgi:hypothetical protein